ncbi:MAG TPA: FadR/GntR family transcriptional regulator [Solirubrobacteraceae bacterium]|nr:FadR/GntR family transcriptional regulator [Solirubrobacteraceae bacterium]
MASDSVFGPIGRSPRLADVLADKMLDAILSGHFAVGDILPSERALCAQFGVSRTVVREAIRSLSTRGLVRVQSGRGVEVMPVDNAPMAEAMSILVRGTPGIDFAKVHEVRTMLETHVAGVAASRATAADIEALERVVDEMAAAKDETEHKSELDIQFHRLLATAAHNELYIVLLDSLGSVLVTSRRRTLRLPHDHEAWVAEHAAIVAAVRAEDPAAARAAMELHLANVRRSWDAALRMSGPSDEVHLSEPSDLHVGGDR